MIFTKVPTGCTTITEFQPASDTILTVRAVDADDPKTPNGQVSQKSFWSSVQNGPQYLQKILRQF